MASASPVHKDSPLNESDHGNRIPWGMGHSERLTFAAAYHDQRRVDLARLSTPVAVAPAKSYMQVM
jgi:hypothetical protein